MDSLFLTRFSKQLGHWTIHGICNALPSFIIAGSFLNLWKNPEALLAMLLAICVFIVGFAVITSLSTPFGDRSHLLGRAVRLGAAIRSWIAGLSLLLLVGGPSAPKPGFMFVPDIWCGFLAVLLQNKLCEVFHLRGSSFSIDGGGADMHYFAVFTTTMLEGFIISFLLLMISFFCVIFLQAKARRRMLKDLEKAADPAVQARHIL